MIQKYSLERLQLLFKVCHTPEGVLISRKSVSTYLYNYACVLTFVSKTASYVDRFIGHIRIRIKSHITCILDLSYASTEVVLIAILKVVSKAESEVLSEAVSRAVLHNRLALKNLFFNVQNQPQESITSSRGFPVMQR
jgi:hypothetical protein